MAGICGIATSVLIAGAVLVDDAAELVLPALAKVPASLTFSTAPWWKAAVDWMTVNYFDAIEVFRTGFLIYVLNPLRAFFEGLPWLGVMLPARLCRLAAWRGAAGAHRRRCWPPSAPPPGCGCRPWRRSICAASSALIAALIGIPIGVARALQAGRAARDADHRHAADHPVLLLHHSGGDAVPGRRCHRAHRHRRLRHRAGDPLHQSWHPAGAA